MLQTGYCQQAWKGTVALPRSTHRALPELLSGQIHSKIFKPRPAIGQQAPYPFARVLKNGRVKQLTPFYHPLDNISFLCAHP